MRPSPVLPDIDKDDLSFERALPLTHAADPAAEILIAYEMNGARQSPDHGPRSDSIVPNWYAVASVKWLKRIDASPNRYAGEFQTGHYIYEWPDRPHEAVTLIASVRASPSPQRRRSAAAAHGPGKAWSGTGTRYQGRASASPAQASGTGATRARHRPLPLAGLVFQLANATEIGRQTLPPERPTPPATCNPRSRRGTGSATETTPSRFVRRRGLTVAVFVGR